MPSGKMSLATVLPSDWACARLGDLAVLRSGSTPSRSEDAFFSGGTEPWVKTGDLNNGRIFSVEEHITPRAVEECGLCIYPAGTVLVAMYGGFRQIGRTGLLMIPASINQALTAINVDPERLLPEFLLHWLNYQVNSWRRLAGSSRKDPNISKADIAGFQVPVPPLSQQRRIAEILALWDVAGQHCTELIFAKREFRKGLALQLLTGCRRLVQFVRSDETAATRYGLRPADWKELTVGEIATEVSRKPGHPGIAVLSCTKHRGLIDSLEYFGKQVFGADTSNYKLVERNQFAYATNHIEEGSIGLLTHRDSGLVSPMYTVFQTSVPVYPPFLYALFKTELYRHIFAVNTNSSVNRRGGLRWGQFSQLPVALPDLPEQRKIAEILDTCDREILLLQRKLEAIQAQKKGLMHKLMTGGSHFREMLHA